MLLPELGTYLQTAGIGTLGTDLFLGELPANPDNCVAILEYGGMAPEHDLGTTALRYEFPRVQVVVRNTSYATGRLKAQDILGDMAAVANETLTSVYYLEAAPLQSPFLLERDDNDRWVFACNYQITKASTSV